MMFEKVIKVPLPFHFCERCKRFELTSDTIMADGEPCFTVYRCANEGFCHSIVKEMDRAERSE